MDIIWKKIKILTFPLNSYYSFKNPEIELRNYDERVLFDEIGEGNERLDKVKLLKNSIYGTETNIEKWIFSQMNIFSNYFLTLRNNKLYIDENEKYEDYRFFNIYVAEGENVKKYLWYYLKRLINKDIVKACFVTNNFHLSNPKAEIEIINSSIFISDSLLENILEKGISETHMHAGAGRNFSFLWIDVMNNKISESIEMMTYEGIVDLRNHLLLTQLVRIITSNFLSKKNELGDFQKFIKNHRDIIDIYYSGKIKCSNELEMEILEKIEEYKKINGIDILNIESEDTLKELTLKTDIISGFFNSFYCNGTDKFFSKTEDDNVIVFPENILLYKAFKYLNEYEDDDYFSRIFVQYIRFKNIFEQYVRQQENDGKGLDIFKKKYRQQSILNLKNSLGEVFYTHLETQNIKKMEIRIKPEKEGEIEKQVKNILKEYLKLIENTKYSDTNFPRIGVVFHFIKEKSNGDDKCYNLYEKSNQEKYLFFGDVKSKNKELAISIINLMNKIPELGNYIVGIDVASGENDTEPYVFRDIYEMFRDKKYMYDKNYFENKFSNTLGFTYHVGEEFRDIISGLRHIDEVIEHYGFIPGDRIGHGIVLGIEVDKWSEINKTIFLPINEYFDNLLWEWGCYACNNILKTNENISYLENCIYETAEKLFGYIEGVTVRDLYDLYISKFKSEITYCMEGCIEKETKRKYEIEKKCQNISSESTRWNRAKLRRAINCKYFLRSMDINVSIEINNYRIEKYKKLQEFMKRKLNQKGIVIEVNPSSNIMIGEFNSYKDFHIENLSSPQREQVIVTVNTDDPITFNTNLSNEYSLLMDLMIKRNAYTRKEILDWIDKIRENGNNFSFIKNRTIGKVAIVQEIKSILEKL